MKFVILSLFPGYFKGPLDESILGLARKKGLITIDLVDIRRFSEDKHKRVDDRPYGGGPGMVMMPNPIVKAVRSVKKTSSKVVYVTPQGRPLNQRICKELSLEEELIILCGHYEGVDERAIDLVVDEEISIGDYVLTNGCLAAIVLVDAVSRFIEGVLGHKDSVLEESFEKGLLDCPHYTRPFVFEEKKVPEVLISGNHEDINTWRKQKAYEKTKRVRPDLLSDYDR